MVQLVHLLLEVGAGVGVVLVHGRLPDVIHDGLLAEDAAVVHLGDVVAVFVVGMDGDFVLEEQFLFLVEAVPKGGQQFVVGAIPSAIVVGLDLFRSCLVERAPFIQQMGEILLWPDVYEAVADVRQRLDIFRVDSALN